MPVIVKKAGKGVHTVRVGDNKIGFITTDKTKTGFRTIFFPEPGVKGPKIIEAESTSAREAVADRNRLANFAESQLKVVSKTKPKRRFGFSRPKFLGRRGPKQRDFDRA